MEALNRIKRGVADTIQKADDEIRDRARREAERQVLESRGASSSENGRSGRNQGRPNGSSYTPPNVPNTPGSTPARGTTRTSNSEDLELLVVSLQSELDETKRRLDSFDEKLEVKLTQALSAFQEVSGAQVKGTLDELVRVEVEKAMAAMGQKTAHDSVNDASTFEATMRATDANAPSETETEKEKETSSSLSPQQQPISASSIEGLDQCVTSIVAEKVVPRVAESLRKLEQRLSAAEALAEKSQIETAAAKAEAAAAKKEAAEMRAALDDLQSKHTHAPEVAATPDVSPEVPSADMKNEIDLLKVRLEEVAECAFSAAAAAAKAESKSGEVMSRFDSLTEDISAVKASAESASHVAFAAVESSKSAVEKLDELNGTVEALEAKVEKNLSAKGSASPADKGVGKKLGELAKRVEVLEKTEKSMEKKYSELDDKQDKQNALFVTRKELSDENRKAERMQNEKSKNDAKELDKQFEAVTGFATQSCSGKIEELAVSTDSRLAAMKQAVEVELIAVMKQFEQRLDTLEQEADKDDTSSFESALKEISQAKTLAESALRRVNAGDAFAERAERLADESMGKVEELSAAFDSLAEEFRETRTNVESLAETANESAREVARSEIRETEQAVWSTVMLLSESKQTGGSASRGSTSRDGSPIENTIAQANSLNSEVTPVTYRFRGLRKLFKSPRNEENDEGNA